MTTGRRKPPVAPTPPEPAGDVKTTVLLPAALHQRLRLAAVMGHRTARDIVMEALVAWLADQERSGQ